MIFTQIKNSIQNTLKTFYAQRAEHEALIAYDFKLTDFKTSLMQLSFSPIANWPLFIFALVLYFNPFRYQFQILAGSSGLIAFLYTPQWATGIAIGIVCSYFLGLRSIAVAVVLYFISQGELNTILAGSIIVGVFFGHLLKQSKLIVKLDGKVQRMFMYFIILQVINLSIATFLSLYLYSVMSAAGLFSRTMFAYRFEFIMCSLAIYYFIQGLVNSIWGHYYSRIIDEPSKINIFYSTARIIKKMSIGSKMKSKIKDQAHLKLSELSRQFQDASTAYLPKNIIASAENEKANLKLIN